VSDLDYSAESLPPAVTELNTVLLAGGVGGARLADGMAGLLPPGRLTIIANTGDDFLHFGLTICPDLDTILYTLAAVENEATGWGRKGESWRTMAEVSRLGGPEWFALGDLDLASHLTRNGLLAQGHTLTSATSHLASRLGIASRLLPMSDDAAPTLVESDEGTLDFQTWFVARGWQPRVRSIRLPADVRASRQVMAALEKADLIVIAPSNPFVSIDPILNVYPVREMICDLPRLVAAVSPIIAGKAVKGPAAKMMAELGVEASASAVAHHYGEVADLFIYDVRETEPVELGELLGYQTDTLMVGRAERRRLAHEVLRRSGELLDS
jgi:LPPG:FO 2-phospho-L-lactate transferase